MRWEWKLPREPWSKARELAWACDLTTVDSVALALQERLRDGTEEPGDEYQADFRCIDGGRVRAWRVDLEAKARIYFEVWSAVPIGTVDEEVVL